MGNVTRFIAEREASVHDGKAGVRENGQEVLWYHVWIPGFFARRPCKGTQFKDGRGGHIWECGL